MVVGTIDSCETLSAGMGAKNHIRYGKRGSDLAYAIVEGGCLAPRQTASLPAPSRSISLKKYIDRTGHGLFLINQGDGTEQRAFSKSRLEQPLKV